MVALWERFITEALGMMVVISVGNGAIANEVLKKTKGHALGLGFVAIAYGLAFFLAISMFGHISANVNPAMLFAKALIGRLSWRDALVLSVANIFGGFLGGVMVYCLYFAHFSIVPERPSPPRWDDAFVESSYTPPSHTRNAYISYEPRHRSLSSEERPKVVFKYQSTEASGTDGATGRVSSFFKVERSNSLQVATVLHEREKAKDPAYRRAAGEGEEKLNMEPPHEQHAKQVRFADPSMQGVDAGSDQPGVEVVEGHPADEGEMKPRIGPRLRQLAGGDFGGVQLHESFPRASGSRGLFRSGLLSGAAQREKAQQQNLELIAQLEREGITKEDLAVYRGMLVADQNAKLAAFASRPAVLNYAANTVAEVVCTFSLIWFALMLEERPYLLDTPDADNNLVPILTPLLIGFLVIGLVTGMAGPTGYTANPARDLGPRIAHFVLPIPNKGPSEWYYAFVPIVGPLLGGFLGAAAFYGCIQLNEYPDWFEGETNVFGGSWDL